MKKSGASQDQSASELISKRIAELGAWRGKALSRTRTLIKEADPDVVEGWKWVKPTTPGTPVWSHDGIICTGESNKNIVKLTFAKGASLKDPPRLFNSSLDGNVRRAIDIHEGEDVDESAFKAQRLGQTSDLIIVVRQRRRRVLPSAQAVDAAAAWQAFLRAGRRLEHPFAPGATGVRLLSHMRR